MAKQQYTVIVKGVIDAESEEKAKMIVELGVSLSLRLSKSPHEIAIAIEDVTEMIEEKVKELKEKQNG